VSAILRYRQRREGGGREGTWSTKIGCNGAAGGQFNSHLAGNWASAGQQFAGDRESGNGGGRERGVQEEGLERETERCV